MGVYGYSVVSILGGFAENTMTGVLSVVAASLCLLQSTAQTIFIFDASQRVVHWTPAKNEKSEAPIYTDKPARETVTLLLIVNFAMWATNVSTTLCSQSINQSIDNIDKAINQSTKQSLDASIKPLTDILIIQVFCTLRAESSPSQNNFYGMHE